MAEKLCCKVEKLPFLYLGLPLGGYPRHKIFWQPMIDKSTQKLDRWKRFNISRVERQTLCNSVLANPSTYYLSTFAIPQNVASALKNLMQNFFWEGNSDSKIYNLVSWKKVTSSLLDGRGWA